MEMNKEEEKEKKRKEKKPFYGSRKILIKKNKKK